MAIKKELSKNDQVKRENKRLSELYNDIPPDTLKVVEGLIIQAARLRVMLDYMWKDIEENGDTEQFSQSEKTEPYERERPVARLYNTRDKNYQSIIKQLSELLPKGNNDGDKDELKEFLAGGRR